MKNDIINNDIFQPPKGQFKLRTNRYSRTGAFYFITICVKGKQKILFNDKIASEIFTSMEFIEKNEWAKVICCMIMPDHIHIVFQLLEKKTLAELLHSFKSYTGNRINSILGRTGKLWQQQYYEHKIRQDESLWNIIEYCHFNPIRKGLVDDPDKYPYWKLCPENIFE